MFTNKAHRGQLSKLAKLIKLRKRVLAFALSVFTAVSAFAGLDLTAFAAGVGSPVSLTVTVKTEGFAPGEEPEVNVNNIYFYYYYDVVSNLNTHETNSRTDSIPVTKQANETYTGSGNLSELISDSYKYCYAYVYVDGRQHKSDTSTYTDGNFTLTIVVTPDVDRVTPDWEYARIYCFDETNPRSYSSNAMDCTVAIGGAKYTREDGAHLDITNRMITLYANGGKVENVVGAYDNTKTKQLTLWETFSGVDAGTYNSTTSKQIAWIVTKDDKCPDNMKQKSDNSVVKVSKGKITAVAPGDAYVWACRVHPDDPTSVSTTESARVHVHVEDAPSKVVLTHEIPADNNATVVPIRKEELGVGEIHQIYIYMESKNDTLTYSRWRVEVTKGSEYLAVSHYGNKDSFSTKTVEPFRGTEHAYFYVKGIGVKPDGKAATAEVTLTNLYTGKKTKLKVNVSNTVVETTQPVRGADDLSGLVVTSQRVKMSYALPHKTLNNYYKTSAQKYLTETDGDGNVVIPPKYAAIIDSPTSDKPQIIVTSDTDVTREMIFKDTKSGLQVNFTGTKSKTVTAKWESGFLQMDVKKDAAAEKGNVIIIFNKSHDMNGVLIVPYQVTSADPE